MTAETDTSEPADVAPGPEEQVVTDAPAAADRVGLVLVVGWICTQRPVAFATDVADDVVHTDPDAVEQILFNLVDNACKYAATAETKIVEVEAHRTPAGLTFSVRDYGPGISKEQKKKIFRLFYRSENELTRETVGTGIGLALVRELVQRMGGSVDVVNRDPGAEFRLALPVAKPS